MNEPTPPRRTRRRRVNPDRPPFDQLPIVTADSSEGPVRTVRGTLELDELTDTQRNTLQANPGHEYVVLTNTLGQHLLAERDQLVPGHLDLTRIGTLPRRDDIDMVLGDDYEPDDLARLVFALEGIALWSRDLADTYQALLDAGWQMTDDEDAAPWGNIVQIPSTAAVTETAPDDDQA